MIKEAQRDNLIDRAAAAFAKGALSESEFEAFAVRVQSAASGEELEAAERELQPISPRNDREHASKIRELSLNMSTLKKSGEWVDAGAYRLSGKMSNFVLDLCAYRDETDFALAIDVDLTMSNLRIIVPSDWRVDVRIDRNTASNVKDRGQRGRSGNVVAIRGALNMSNVKIRRRRNDGERRGLFFLLFGPRN